MQELCNILLELSKKTDNVQVKIILGQAILDIKKLDL